MPAEAVEQWSGDKAAHLLPVLESDVFGGTLGQDELLERLQLQAPPRQALCKATGITSLVCLAG